MLSGQKKNASNTSNRIPTFPNSKLIVSFVPLATSGYVSGLIQLIAQYLGMLIVRAVWPRRCPSFNFSSYNFIFIFIFILFFFFKKIIRNNKNVYALEERNTLFSKDPDVRKFDAERLLCNICDKWMNVPSDDHLQAVQKWLQHRASCQKTVTSSTSMS